MEHQRNLIIFIKNLLPGKVKTRISIEKGDEVALKIYHKLLSHTSLVSQKVNVEKFCYFNEFIPENPKYWNSRNFKYRMQTKGDLGFKMKKAFEEILPLGPTIIIGSDCPGIDPMLLEEAFSVLENKDGVIGPATDGGYYLLGLKESMEFLFEEMPWSSEQLFKKTMDQIQEKGKEFGLLRELSDVDYWDDWVELGWNLE